MNEQRFSASEISQMRDQIRQLASDGTLIRFRIHDARGLERHRLWNEKRRVGRQARMWLLLYGFARGVPYRSIERQCHEGNDPRWHGFLPALERFDSDARLDRELKNAVERWTGRVAAAPTAIGT